MSQPSPEELRELALTEAEYRSVADQLGREPNRLELGMVGAMWSEHCSYKTSKPLLRQFSSAGARVVLGPGENAGVVDLGQGLLCCFKIESHNHPSAIEPVQGAATGVGGILRDVFAMGARPVALLDAIRFGDLSEPLQRHRFDRVVEGIGWYGNCIGVPTVGGETYFDDGYRANCLVNAMCVGLVEQGALMHARAAGPGNPVLLVGADSGRDGIHGATFASVELDQGAEARRPAVQVGNPFLEKCLMEACLELAGRPTLVALQDCGAAGLTSSCAEMAHRGGVGLEIDVARVSRREQGMDPYEVMLSESQERMVLVVELGSEAEYSAVFQRWGLHSDVIGRVIEEPQLRVLDQGALAAQLPLETLVSGAGERHPSSAPPPGLEQLRSQDPLLRPPPWSLRDSWLRLLGAANCGETSWIWRQYDHQVGDDTVALPGGDAAILRLRGRRDALALTVDGAHRSAGLEPGRGAAIALAEAVRNISAVGATPLAITNCLNFGNPDRPEVMWQLAESVAGLAEAARQLELPVVSGNVSLYNDFGGMAVPPTPVVGVVGQLPELAQRGGMAFRQRGDLVVLLGRPDFELGGSEYQRLAHGLLEGPAPELDLAQEARTCAVVRDGVAAGLLLSAHDCSLGGLAVAVTECCLPAGIGAQLTPPLQPPAQAPPGWAHGLLFGETQGRFVVSCAPGRLAELGTRCDEGRVPWVTLGEVGGAEIAFSGLTAITLEEAEAAFGGALPSRMDRPGDPPTGELPAS